MLIDGDRLTVSWPGRAHPRRHQHRRREPAHPEVFRRQHAGASCADSFDIVSEKADDRPSTYRLTMVPRRKQIREGLSRLELWLDQTSLLLAAMRMTFPNGDTKLMVLEDVVANAPHRSRRCSARRPISAAIGQPRRDRLVGGRQIVFAPGSAPAPSCAASVAARGCRNSALRGSTSRIHCQRLLRPRRFSTDRRQVSQYSSKNRSGAERRLPEQVVHVEVRPAPRAAASGASRRSTPCPAAASGS